MIKILSKLRIKRTHLNVITVRVIYDSPTAKIILNMEMLEASPLRIITRQGCPLSSLLFNIVLEILVREIGQDIKAKAFQIVK